MPGLSQLQKLSEDVLKLGNEPKLRAERGEKPVVAAIPPDVEDIDDSEDFVLGMPEKAEPSPEETAQKNDEAAALAAAASDLENLLSGGAASAPESPIEPDLSSLLNPMGEIADDVPDLSAFEEPPAPPVKEEPSISDMSLDDLLSMPSEDFSEPEPEPVAEPEVPSPMPSVEDFAPVDDFSFDTDAVVEPAVPPVEPEAAIDDVEELAELDDAENESDDFSFDGESIDMNADIPDELMEVPGDPLAAKLQASKDKDNTELDADLEIEDEPNTSDEFTAMPDMDFAEPEAAADFEAPVTEQAAVEEESVTDEVPTSGGFGFDAIDTTGLDDFGDMSEMFGEAGTPPAPDEPADFDLDASMSSDFGETPAATEEEFDPASVDLSGLNLGGDADETPEVFDTSEMAGVTFDNPPSDSMDDFNIKETDSQLQDNDFELDSAGAGEPDFEIVGFTGADANPFDKSGRPKAQIQESSPEEKRKNTLTDAEYKRFKTNLAYYPLNVRIALEDMIVKNEFTDDVIFEVIEKVLKKVPARQLASHLEKMLDIQLSVPRDYERRTAEEYEAYKQSIQYQLKNRIIPAIIIGVFIAMIGLCSVYLGVEYIYKPIRSEQIYRQGYTLLENNEYPQSETMFNEALKLKQKKKWFFKYAMGYRNHKQYDRAENMYKQILRRFDHDKQGGLEYTRMELDDLANYPKAEEIIRREVLDYHINDQEAMLLLGDIFLEWGTEEEPAKLEDAFEQYSILVQLYPDSAECPSRMMRYHVRKDHLKEVIAYKEIFYPDEKSLSADDWTEMSGYLMDKLYGDLTPQEEYLRSSIEDVHSMLIRAVKRNPENPVSRYNIARYYINSGDHIKSTEDLKKTLDLFEKAKRIKKRDVYKQINTYRLLGEQYLYSRDYILAQKTLSDGIDFFEEKNSASGFESDKNVGVMYSDMADIDYFVSGDLENAERNYINSINNKNDSPKIRYKVGYINYGNKDYDKAFNNFIIAASEKDDDKNLMLAIGNTLSLRNDDYAGAGYYQRLLDLLNLEINKRDIILPQVDEDDSQLVNTYMKASNNLGVSQYRLARQSGNSSLNGESLNNLQNSLRAWDSLTRNQNTMVRLGGTNLAEQNLRYIVSPMPAFEPAIYTEIPRILENEKRLE